MWHHRAHGQVEIEPEGPIRGEMVVKISKERVSQIVKAGTGAYFDPRHDGRLMKEWVVVGAGKTDWIDLAREAHAFVAGAKEK